MATVLNQKVHSGQTIVIKIGKYFIGRAQGLNARRSFGTQGLYEVGSIMPEEHVPHKYEGTATLDRFLVRNNSLKDLGIASLGEEVLKKNVIDIEVIDKVSKDVIRVYRGCTISDYNEVVKANAICGENATFQYMTCSDNTDINSDESQFGVIGKGSSETVNYWNSSDYAEPQTNRTVFGLG